MCQCLLYASSLAVSNCRPLKVSYALLPSIVYAHSHIAALFCLVQARTYLSTDWATDANDAASYPTELLNEQTLGLPPHKLTLKKGFPVMLLRNMSSQQGLCNGTRLIVKEMYRHVLECEIATGAAHHIGKRVLIPRITLSPSDDVLPFTLKRKQFPVRPAFAMTINKAQGQTVEFAAGYLPMPCFSHGQLYVLMSRVGSPLRLTIMIPGGRAADGTAITDNVVYREVLD